MTIKTIAQTKEIPSVTAEELNKEQMILGGKFGGTCYAKEGYQTIRRQPIEKALVRAENAAKRGHHSVFGHGMITMEINCSKIIAMLLNSIGVSNTSEKSARYTQMEPDTALEKELYVKWHDIFVQRIGEEYPLKFTEKEIDKLAYENARYLISVFSKTSMVYSLPFRNIFYVIDWTEKMIKNLETMEGSFNQRLCQELKELKEAFLGVVGNCSFHDNKNEMFRFMPVQATGCYDDDNKEYFGDVYTAKFTASFAQVAQEQRHRTTRVKINFSGKDTEEFGYYVPAILRNTDWENEWLSDCKRVKDVYIQGMLVSVTEQGLFEDFALKCKERMCGRAQLEIMEHTNNLVLKFAKNKDNLSKKNRERLEDMLVNDVPCARCGYSDFVCEDGCKWGKSGAITRLI